MKLKFKSNPLGIIILYFIGMIIGMLLGMMIFGAIATKVYDVSFGEATRMLSLSTDEFELLTENQLDVYYYMNSWLNFSQYFVMAIVCIIYSKDYFIEDIGIVKKDKKRFLIMLGVGVGVVLFLWGLSELTNVIVEQLNHGKPISSSNQGSLESMILNGHAAILFFTIFILAPVVEELVYRKAIFKLLGKTKCWIPIVVSALVFALPHMLSAENSVLIWIIFFLNYFISGLSLALVYHYSKNNIYASICVHMMNNLLSFILVFF